MLQVASEEEMERKIKKRKISCRKGRHEAVKYSVSMGMKPSR